MLPTRAVMGPTIAHHAQRPTAGISCKGLMSARSSRKLQPSAAVSSIRQHGALLVFPINNRGQPHSLWAEFFPRTRMVWDWNEDSDYRVGDMWQLMKHLSDCREVVYSKWYQGRATFFSHDVFVAMVSVLRSHQTPRHRLSEAARVLFEVLENNSPLSTRQLKEFADLQGRANEAAYTRGMKELFNRLLIVGYGEVDDGAFPSLAVGATELLFEDLWREAAGMPPAKATTILDRFMPAGSHFRRHFEKNR
jgi:hypothetical protein